MADISYFRSILSSDRRARELAAHDGPIVGTLCNFVPEELIVAAGALPLRLCAGDHDASDSVEDIFPRDVCSAAKSALGLIREAQGVFGRIDLLVVPTSCDAKKKLADVVSRFVPVHTMLLPPAKDADAGKALWLSEVERFKTKLEELTGTRINRRGLREAVELLNARQQTFRRFLELWQSDPPLVTGEEALYVAGASFHDNIGRWTDEVTKLCEGAQPGLAGHGDPVRDAASDRRPALQHGSTGGTGCLSTRGPQCQDGTGTERPVAPTGRWPQDGNASIQTDAAPRLLLTGAPLIYPNFKLARIIEQSGAVIAADDLCSSTQRLNQPVVPSEWSMRAMMQAVAEKYLLPSVCPCFTDSADRINKIEGYIEDLGIDGVVYHNLRMCALFDIESHQLRDALQALNVPMLTLHTDYSPEDTEQLRNRVEAFIEMLGGR